MLLSLLAIACGLVLLLWSAERFVISASAVAAHLGMPPLLIGMLVVGFGTSAPEMTVSVFAALGDNAGIALGNAYGSNITNIALILGLTALISPVAVQSRVLRVELPILVAVTALAAWQLSDGMVSRVDAAVLLGAFALLLAWSILEARHGGNEPLADQMAEELPAGGASIRSALTWLVVGLLVLVASSRLLVWGAVDVAASLGVSDLVVGLTIVAIGTSLPELASSLVAARRGEHDLAVGNILGSNLFNTMAVIGLAALARPLPVGGELMSRDLPVLGAVTLLLLFFGIGWRGPGRINRWEGGLLLAAFVAYTVLLVVQATR
ncbi:MAG: calcium/sodium antiporter [Wenzhouxiangellaceae bacterium]|nr:calcium/sodium antiporter [Wenzhouxiangellaceae bacterium]